MSDPARLVTITAIARMVGRQKRTMARTLIAMRSHDAEIGADTEWMTRFGNRWMINLSRLKAAHPALFEADYVERDEITELQERLLRLEGQQSETRIRVGVHGAKLRELSKAGT